MVVLSRKDQFDMTLSVLYALPIFEPEISICEWEDPDSERIMELGSLKRQDTELK